MPMNLAEAVKLKSILFKRISEQIYLAERNAKVVHEKGIQPIVPSPSLAELEAEIADLRKDSRKLDALIYRANIDNTISFEGEEIAIVEAIELATQLRAEAQFCKNLGQSMKESYYHSVGDIPLYEVALYEPNDYRERALLLEKRAHRLSNLINNANYSITIDFDDTKYF